MGLLISSLFLGLMSWQAALPIIIGCYFIFTLFAFITLPVEYDASNRALAWLESANMLTPREHDGAKDALKWAARTYVVAAIGSLATLLYFALQILGSRR